MRYAFRLRLCAIAECATMCVAHARLCAIAYLRPEVLEGLRKP
jgi:hypothetical protein